MAYFHSVSEHIEEKYKEVDCSDEKYNNININQILNSTELKTE
jgi:hypothetical protein